MTDDYRTRPIDPQSAERLAASGLRLDLVDTADSSSFDPWLLADSRGFHDAAPNAEQLGHARTAVDYRRTTGVWDETLPDPEVPVATVSSWPDQFTVPGHRSVTGWAISAVTVSPTHRRRGVARAMLEAELRTAATLGVPIATLTVSEATIYGRYGFGPAVFAAAYSIDNARARWTGPIAPGSVQFISSDALLEHGPEIFERARLGLPGDIKRWTGRWHDLLDLDDPVKSRDPRVVRYVDEHGIAQGFAIYLLRDLDHPVRKRVLEVRHLITVTDDAYAGLWRFLLEQDLVTEVTADLRPVDEPLAWQVEDRRAVKKTAEQDHLWSRILDVPEALSARAYAGPARLGFTVTDPLGFAAGSFVLDVDADGAGSVSAVDELPPDARGLALGVAELSSIYFGGVSVVQLARAGRATELSAGSAAAVDAAFLVTPAPWLSIWF